MGRAEGDATHSGTTTVSKSLFPTSDSKGSVSLSRDPVFLNRSFINLGSSVGPYRICSIVVTSCRRAPTVPVTVGRGTWACGTVSTCIRGKGAKRVVRRRRAATTARAGEGH